MLLCWWLYSFDVSVVLSLNFGLLFLFFNCRGLRVVATALTFVVATALMFVVGVGVFLFDVLLLDELDSVWCLRCIGWCVVVLLMLWSGEVMVCDICLFWICFFDGNWNVVDDVWCEDDVWGCCGVCGVCVWWVWMMRWCVEEWWCGWVFGVKVCDDVVVEWCRCLFFYFFYRIMYWL